MERQNHGFIFEQHCKTKYGIALSNNYTNKWDGTLNNNPVSIKCEKLGSDIELADYFRNSKITDNFYLIVGFWEGEKTNIVEEHILFISGWEFHELFNPAIDLCLRNLLCSISNNKEDDMKWREEISKMRQQWKETTPNLVRLRFKRDHKSQKRIQCAINNKDFYRYFVNKYEVKL